MAGISKDEILSGTLPVPLDERGRHNVHQLANHLVRNGGLHMIVTSDIPRAHQTAQILHQATRAPMRLTKALHGWHMGSLEGTKEIDSKPQALKFSQKTPDDPVPGTSSTGVPGESFNHFNNRVMNEIENLRQLSAAHPESRIAAVTHSRVLSLLHANIEKKDPSQEEPLHEKMPSARVFHLSDKGLSPINESEFIPKGLLIVRHGETEDDS